ncbi:serine protease AprX [Hydrogenispora ethanolica]|uniref:Serine protease AprX n=1 Tax=Hydrogenispora ethanolica TaxID=1082276 RepID=A0A4V2QF82_HYDET|nr:S8 family peptidase [Hydrogenispora ethanolica]TCL70917.1 serine protease AprX [Hydrogenispora ethanolica]
MPLQFSWSDKLSSQLRQATTGKTPDSVVRCIAEVVSSKTDRLLGWVEAAGGRLHHRMNLMPALVIDLPYASLEEFAHFSQVSRVWQDLPVQAMLDVTIPAIGAASTRQLGFSGAGIVVAVLDTGIFPHEDLTTPYNRILAWNDLLNGRRSPYDDNGHGTHVAGIIAGNGSSFAGKYCGVAPEARLVGIKVLDEYGNGWTSDVISGIEWCIQNQRTLNIKVLNLSLGGIPQADSRWDPLSRATTGAWQRGIVVCAANGNGGLKQGTVYSPALNRRIIRVGNIDDQQTLVLENNSSLQANSIATVLAQEKLPDLVAPGSEITSLKVDGGYTELSGSSMATPLVAGAAALILQKWPQLKPDQVKMLMIKRSRDLGLGRALQGFGALDLEKIFGRPRTREPKTAQPLEQMAGEFLFKTLLGLLSQRSSSTNDSSPKGNEFLKTILSIFNNLQ